MSHPGSNYFETIVREGPAGPERYPRHIDLIYGSGGRGDEVFFTWKGNGLFELPVSWLRATHEWGEEPFNANAPGDLTRTTTTRCVECHNTWFAHVPGTENLYQRENLILGVTCEKCHGPARDHVAYHHDHPGATGNHAIVHPGRLSRDRLMDVCAQCHSSTIHLRRPPFTYRAGEPLDDYFRTMTLEDREQDHVADQVRYLRQSKCFQNSSTLTCVTCHDPHRPQSAETVAHACSQCHKPEQCPEQKTLPAGVRGDCVGCHMPRYNRVAIHFDTARDRYQFPMRPREHRIAVYPAARDEVLLMWYRAQPGDEVRRNADVLTGKLTDDWLAESRRLRTRFRFLRSIGAAREAVRLNPTPATRDFLQTAIALQRDLDHGFEVADRQILTGDSDGAIRTLRELLEHKPDWAQVHQRLGALYSTAGDRARAVEHLRAASRYAPDDPFGHNLLGWLAYLDGRAEEAADEFRLANEEYPFTAEINYRWGLALLSLERWGEAETRFREALVVDPHHAGACQGLSHVLRHEGKAREAVRLASQAASLTHFENADILLSLADAFEEAGQPAEAGEAAHRALQAAERDSPEQAAEIRQRIGQPHRAIK